MIGRHPQHPMDRPPPVPDDHVHELVCTGCELRFISPPPSDRDRLLRLMKMLSPRQQQVFEDYARGQSHKEIAARLGISEHTVRHHLEAIGHKLDMPLREAAWQAYGQ